MFAEAAPPDHAAWMTNLTYLLSMVAVVVSIAGNFSNRKQRRAVTFETEFARKSDLERVESSLTGFRESIEQIQRDIVEAQREAQRAGEGRARAMHERMDGISVELTRAVGEIRGELKCLSRP